MYGKVVAKPGQRDTLLQLLLQASRLLTPFPGCDLYIVNIVPSDPDTIWVTELWASEADCDDSLKMDSIKEVIAMARPLIAAFESIRLLPVGGKGLAAV